MKIKRILLLLFALFLFLIGNLFATVNRGMWKKDLPYNVNLSNTMDNWVDLPAASTTSVLNSVSISTQTLVTNTTSYTLALGDITDVVFPRNVVADTAFSSGESTTTVSGVLTITGIDQFGRSQTEALVVSTNSVTGSRIWSNITQLSFTGFTITGSSEDNIILSVGTSTKIGLSNNIKDSNDIVKVIEAGSTSTTYTLNSANDGIIFASAPDNLKDYYVYYLNRTNKTRYKY
jgi:hypothetical protein